MNKKYLVVTAVAACFVTVFTLAAPRAEKPSKISLNQIRTDSCRVVSKEKACPGAWFVEAVLPVPANGG